MKIRKIIDKRIHEIEFLKISQLEKKLINNISNLDILIFDSNIVKNTLIKKVSNYVNIDVSISSLEIPELKKPKLIFPKSIDIIGKNGKYFLGQFVDFNKKIDILRANISYYYNFVNELKDIQNSYLIGVQPDKDKATNNEYWDDVKDYPLIKLVPIDELSKLEDQIIENQVKPILS